jgi:Domain of unknown function (DUF6265)
MKSRIAAILLAAVPLMVSANDTAPEMPQWMTGAWSRSQGENWAEEYWTTPRGGIMLGASRSGRDEKLTFWEHMRIVRQDDGKLVFWAIAGDQKPVRFVAVRHAANEIIFDNPDHDYPQRIRYWRDGEQLKARISLIDGSKAGDFAFGPVPIR